MKKQCQELGASTALCRTATLSLSGTLRPSRVHGSLKAVAGVRTKGKQFAWEQLFPPRSTGVWILRAVRGARGAVAPAGQRDPSCDLADPALTKQNRTGTRSVQTQRPSREKEGIALVPNQPCGLSLMLKTVWVCVQAREEGGKLSAWLLQVVLMHGRLITEGASPAPFCSTFPV